MTTDPWGTWQELGPDEVYSDHGYRFEGRLFLNNRYQVEVVEMASGITWLSIKRLKKEHVHDWRELWRIKNELTSPDREAFEIYPANWRVVDSANQYHLWVLPLGIALNIGFLDRHVEDTAPDRHEFGKPRQRPLPKWMERTERPGLRVAGFSDGSDKDGNISLIVDFREQLKDMTHGNQAQGEES